MRISDWSSDVCSSDLVIDAVRGGVFEGTLAYDRTTREYDYADNVWGTGGVLPASEVDEAVMGTGGAYLASKKPGGMCKGPWTLPCIVIPVIIDEISDGGGEQRSEEHTSELQSLM